VKRVFLIFFTVSLVLLVSTSYPVSSQTYDSNEFVVPAKLRPRVNFWKSIFSKYGRNQIVIHHRIYPQMVFEVIDLALEADLLSINEVEALKKRRTNYAMQRVKNAFSRLASGYAPSTPLETKVATLMTKYFGYGTEKYKRALREDLLRSQTGIKEKHILAIKKSGRYLAKMEEIFRSYGLPIELTRLPFIESSFDYTAYSSVGAAGIWQFMRSTGRSFLRIDSSVDERRDPIKATYAAAQYLLQAHQRLGSWPLAVTSYNHGVAGVARRTREMGTRDITRIIEHPTNRPFGFASSNFYPELLAAIEVYKERESLFPGLELEEPEKYVVRKTPQRMYINNVSRYFGVSIATLKLINYSFTNLVWQGRVPLGAGYEVKIPTSQTIISREYPVDEPPTQNSHPNPFVIKPTPAEIFTKVVTKPALYHFVRKGESLGLIARRYGVSIATLRSLNRLRTTLVRVGQRLLVKSATNQQVQASVQSRQAPVQQANGVVFYTVKRGDSLTKIAQLFKTSLNQLQQLNGYKARYLYAGQKIKVPRSSTSSPFRAPQAPTYHVVKAGDSLWAISKRYSVSTAQLLNLNGRQAKILRVGTKVRVR
jgi:membrane-bound lytic murein transglycosylase D